MRTVQQRAHGGAGREMLSLRNLVLHHSYVERKVPNKSTPHLRYGHLQLQFPWNATCVQVATQIATPCDASVLSNIRPLACARILRIGIKHIILACPAAPVPVGTHG